MSKRVVNMLCIRDPDYSNDYTFDADVNEITIDIGGNWSDYKDFCADLREGGGEAEDYERGLLEEVAHLPTSNVVRQAVESFFSEARNS